MKVRLNSGVDLARLTHGKEYYVLKTEHFGTYKNYQYHIINDCGCEGIYHHSHFTIIDEPVIEVDSEWLADHMPDEVATVKYVGREKVFIEWLDGSEGDKSIEIFLKDFKPKPKTVTMYFYDTAKGLFAKEYKPTRHDVLFTCEIEL